MTKSPWNKNTASSFDSYDPIPIGTVAISQNNVENTAELFLFIVTQVNLERYLSFEKIPNSFYERQRVYFYRNNEYKKLLLDCLYKSAEAWNELMKKSKGFLSWWLLSHLVTFRFVRIGVIQWPEYARTVEDIDMRLTLEGNQFVITATKRQTNINWIIKMKFLFVSINQRSTQRECVFDENLQ